jgi:hypothetical protein
MAAATPPGANPGVTAEMAYDLPCTEATLYQLLRRHVYAVTPTSRDATLKPPVHVPLKTNDVWSHLYNHNRTVVLEMWDAYVRPRLADGHVVLEGPEGVDPLHAITGLFAVATQLVLMSHAMGMPLTVGVLSPNVGLPVARMCMRHALRQIGGPPRRPGEADLSAAGVAGAFAKLPVMQIPTAPAAPPPAAQP